MILCAVSSASWLFRSTCISKPCDALWPPCFTVGEAMPCLVSPIICGLSHRVLYGSKSFISEHSAMSVQTGRRRLHSDGYTSVCRAAISSHLQLSPISAWAMIYSQICMLSEKCFKITLEPLRNRRRLLSSLPASPLGALLLFFMSTCHSHSHFSIPNPLTWHLQTQKN